MLLAPGTRFAYTRTWTIDVNDYGSRFYDIYHVVRSTAKTVLVLHATLFHGDVDVDGNALMDKVLQAYLSNTTILNQNTTPARYKLHAQADGTRCFYTGKGTARKCVRLNGDLFPVTYIRITGKKRARPNSPAPIS